MRTKRLTGKDFYKKMQLAKQAKANKAEKIKKKEPTDLEVPPKVRPILPDTPTDKRLEVTEPTYASKMEENTSPSFALNKALDRIREQSKGL